jgi:hypothetical protein
MARAFVRPVDQIFLLVLQEWLQGRELPIHFSLSTFTEELGRRDAEAEIGVGVHFNI